jgi:hypothetical protein
LPRPWRGKGQARKNEGSPPSERFVRARFAKLPLLKSGKAGSMRFDAPANVRAELDRRAGDLLECQPGPGID